VQLLNRRPEDVSSAGFVDWSFMSVHTWGEDAGGEWLVQVVDSVSEYKHIAKSSLGELRARHIEKLCLHKRTRSFK
jgi:subtilisin-like proprotein convertase family protein